MPPERPDKKKLSEQSIAASKRILETLGEQLRDGDITISDFEASFKAEMKSEYIRQYLYGIGGLAYMTAADWTQVASDLEKQYKFAEAYIDELETAQQEDEDAVFLLALAGDSADEAAAGAAVGALLWRLGLYAESSNAVYEAANLAFHKGEGADEENWSLDDNVEHHCRDCSDYAKQGWVPIGTFPEPGDGHTECQQNCHCWKTYRKSDGSESE